MSLLNASNGVVAAAYEYSPFGELLQQTGSYAAANPFRSATKFTDAETGLIYYGHRYYSPSLGRFINRDPIGENGGLNVYGFVGNDGVNSADYLGLIDFDGDGVDDGSPDDIVIERGDGRTRRRVPPGVDLEALIREATNRQSRRLYTLLLESSTDEGSPLVSSGPYYSGSGIDADRAANKAKVAGELAASHVLPEPKGEIAPSSGGAPSLRQMLAFVATSDAFDPRTRVAAFLAFIPVNLRARLYAAAYEASGGDAMYADAQADIMLGLTAEVGIAGAHAVRRLFSAAESNLTTVYRGVDADHPGLADALQGRAVPRGMGGGHTNPDFHNAGNTVSEFTSWSIRRNVADEFATASGPGGVTLQLRVPRSTLIRTVDGSGESEFLLRGPVQGAKVLQPLRENLPVWFSRQ